jgi:hypothetical protein
MPTATALEIFMRRRRWSFKIGQRMLFCLVLKNIYLSAVSDGG